jgi:hypothetical protein
MHNDIFPEAGTNPADARIPVDIRPEIILPGTGRSESRFAKEIAEVLPDELLFIKDDVIVEVIEGDDPYLIGKTTAASEAEDEYRGPRFVEMTATKLKTWLERHLQTGIQCKQETEASKVRLEAWEKADKETRGAKPEKEFESVFKERTMSTMQAATLLEAPDFREGLSRIARIMDAPIPVMTKNGKHIYPKDGYNPSLGVYIISPEDVEIKIIDPLEARAVIENMFAEFCFRDEQSKIHAIARLLTPYLRGIIGFSERIPFWYFDGNRPGAGKDYCNGVSQIVYLGQYFEDLPISDNPEETNKRIVAALSAGRRAMHFANCQGHLDDKFFIAAVTNKKICGRRLGSNDASADLELRNEVDYSISANIGLTVREDVERRCRKISLAYFEEHENSREFKTDLHKWVHANRSLVLSAIHTLFETWTAAKADGSYTEPKFTFTSFPRWAQVLGSIMSYHGLGNPCKEHEVGLLGGDLKLRAMTALYESAYERDASRSWWSKAEIFNLITESQAEDDDRLAWFGDLEGEKDKIRNRQKVGIALKEFSDRVLSGIKLIVDTSSAHSGRQKVKFCREGEV